MIFSTVRNITSKDEFLEKILVYIRIVEVIAERNNTLIPNAIMTDAVVSEMKDMGVIDCNSDLPILKTKKCVVINLIN